MGDLWARRLLLRRTRSLLRTRLALGFLRGFGIGFAEAFPQSLERVGATLGSQRFVAFESLGHGLDDGLVHAFGAGFTFPKVEDLDHSADDGGVVVSVPVFETEEFAEFFEGGEHETILSWGRGYTDYADLTDLHGFF